MTQGIISIIKNDKVFIKCVSGCDGYNAQKAAKIIRRLDNITLEKVYNICIENDFGCEDCLVVQGENDFIYKADPDFELPELYIKKFNDPAFNPRWEKGTAPYVVKIFI